MVYKEYGPKNVIEGRVRYSSGHQVAATHSVTIE